MDAECILGLEQYLWGDADIPVYSYLSMNQKYDVVVCGTGLIQCILSGLLSQEGKRVLHIDRNDYYGGEGASVNLTNMWKIFRGSEQPPKELGHNRDWNIDLIPKYVMSGGTLIKILFKTHVSRYLEWKPIDGTYVMQNKEAGFFSKGGNSIAKVPASAKQALTSDLMGMLEKRRCQKFMEAMQDLDLKNPKSYEGIDIEKPAKIMLDKFGLQENTIDFIGHAVALCPDDSFINAPAVNLIRKVQLYMDSMGKYGGNSPFLYPIYGLGGIPEGFSRISAVYGGTFMLKTDITEFIFENGRVAGVRGPEGQAFCKEIICDPTYALKCGLANRVDLVQKIIRCICILDHPIPGTDSIPSVQIIIPQRQSKRQNDIYIMMVSGVHAICQKDCYIAIVSTVVETPNPQEELALAFELLGPVKHKFVRISERYVPKKSAEDGIFISNSFDASSNFESETDNVLDLYRRITGKELDLSHVPSEDQDD